MSISKRLAGGGGSFGALAQGEARGRADAAARSDVLDATGRVRRSSLAPVSSIVFNPLNPRKTIVDETIAELGQSLSRHQVVPVTVVSREAFLDAHPGHAAELGNADFVALDGNRRLLAAQRAGLQNLRVDLNDDLVATAADMVEAALVANVHREDVAPFEEAQAIEQLLTTVYDGNQAAVARKLGKSAAWVGQRLALLHLTPELQELASAGELAIEDARKIGAQARAGKLTAADQREWADEAKKAAADKQVAKATAKAPRAARTVVQSATASDRPDSAAPRETADRPEVNGVYAPAARDSAVDGVPRIADGINGVYVPAVPEQREAVSEDQEGAVAVRLYPADPLRTAQAIHDVLDEDQIAQVASALLGILQSAPDVSAQR